MMQFALTRQPQQRTRIYHETNCYSLSSANEPKNLFQNAENFVHILLFLMREMNFMLEFIVKLKFIIFVIRFIVDFTCCPH